MLADGEFLDLARAGQRITFARRTTSWVSSAVTGGPAYVTRSSVTSVAAAGIARPDECPDDFTPVVVRQADDGHLCDRRMLVEDLFDLGGEKILTAADDHVLEPADDPAVASLIHRRQVTGTQPSVGAQRLARLLGFVEVAGHREVPPGPQFP